MTPSAVEDDLQSAVLAMRADVRASLALSRIAVQTLEALCPEGDWLGARPPADAQPAIRASDEHSLALAIECALIDAAEALGEIGTLI
jgi:hypothetical protein